MKITGNTLLRVEKPGRYTGGEEKKRFDSVRVLFSGYL
jgi:hypothetical protein